MTGRSQRCLSTDPMMSVGPRRGTASLLPDALRLLTMALAKERVPRVREAIFTALAKIGSSESAAVAISLSTFGRCRPAHGRP